MNPIEIKGDWSITKDRMKQKWPALTDEDLFYSTGRFEDMLGRIHDRTGQTRTTIERFFADSARRQR